MLIWCPRHVQLVCHSATVSNADEVADWLITDGRFSGATRGLMIGHVAPEAARGGPLAAIAEGDTIAIDVEARQVNVELSDGEIQDRLARWREPAPHYTSGVFATYAALVCSASDGAITPPPRT